MVKKDVEYKYEYKSNYVISAQYWCNIMLVITKNLSSDFLSKNTLKIALQYLFNVVLLYKTVFSQFNFLNKSSISFNLQLYTIIMKQSVSEVLLLASKLLHISYRKFIVKKVVRLTTVVFWIECSWARYFPPCSLLNWCSQWWLVAGLLRGTLPTLWHKETLLLHWLPFLFLNGCSKLSYSQIPDYQVCLDFCFTPKAFFFNDLSVLPLYIYIFITK